MKYICEFVTFISALTKQAIVATKELQLTESIKDGKMIQKSPRLNAGIDDVEDDVEDDVKDDFSIRIFPRPSIDMLH